MKMKGYIELKGIRFGIDNTRRFFIWFYGIMAIYLLPLCILGAFDFYIPIFLKCIGILGLFIAIIFTFSINKLKYQYCIKDGELLHKYIDSYSKRREIKRIERVDNRIWLLYINKCKYPAKLIVGKDLDWYMVKIEYILDVV